MRIALVAPPFFPVPPTQGGGAVQEIVCRLSDQLQLLGHEVTVFASQDSTVQAPVRSIVGPASYAFDPSLDRMHVEFAYECIDEFDILHDHTYLGHGLGQSRNSSIPSLITVHTTPLQGASDNTLLRYQASPKAKLISISFSQRRTFPDVNFFANIPNGINVELFAYNAFKADYLLFVGEINFRKGAHIAIQAAKRTGHRLLLAGAITDYGYFERLIYPFLDREVEYIGEVSGDAKVALFQRAKALLAPVIWQEPFGLVLVEAMSCGTPVIAFDRGAIPEIVRNEKTGFVVTDLDEMCHRVCELESIDPHACRLHVESLFTDTLMAQRYLNLYCELQNNL